MVVRSYGISVEPGHDKVTLEDLFVSLESTSGQLNQTFTSHRMIFVSTTQDPDFFVGLVVTVKDQKTYCELVQGTLTINVVNLTNNLMEFNFFVVNKANGLGIYQHYHQSCSPGAFAQYLKQRYRELTDQSRTKEFKAATVNGVLSAKAEKEIRSLHAGALKVGTLTHAANLAAVLAQYKRIKAFEYELAQVESDAKQGVPVGSYALREYKRFTFGDTAVKTVANAIESTVKKIGIVRGHVNVIEEIDDEDVPVSVKLANIPENFGERDFDQVAGLLNNLNANHFAKHAITQLLLNDCKGTYSATFLQKIKPKGVKGKKKGK